MRTSITMRACTLTLILWASVQFTAYSQGVTSAAINGKVTAKSGEALPGVNIVAVHEPSGTKYGTTTRSDGRYNLAGLRVGGPYTVTASIVGYQKQVYENLYLRLSENQDLNFSLAEEAVQGEEVVIVGERTAIFNASHQGAVTNVTRDRLDQLPTVSRNFQDYLKLSPYFTGSNNALGRNAKFNNIQIDGGNFNDLFGLGSSGTPAGQASRPVTPISLDAIQEFQIALSPFDVRQSGFTGAGVNAITRSGTNNLKASGYYYGGNENFVGKSPDSLKKKLAGFTDYKLGASVGGPIIENDLFYFASGEIARYKAPFTNTFGAQQIGTNSYPANADSLAQLSNYLKSKYGYDPGSYTSIGNKSESDKFFIKFDYNLSEEHKLTARYNYLSANDDNSPSRGRSANNIYFDNGKYLLQDKTHSAAVQLTSVFGNTASNELIVGYVNQKDNPIYYGAPFPTLYISTYGTGTQYTGNLALVLGAEEFRHYNLLEQKYFEITDNFSYYLPGHTLTAGVKVDLFSFRNLFIPDGFGAYTYNSIAQFLNDQRANSYSFRYSATSNPQQEANWGANQFGIYAQDEWTVNPALKITAGVRVDIPTYPDHPNYNAQIDQIFGYRTDTPPKTSVAFSPRLGFNYAIDEERNTQIRGGVGVFYGRFPYVWVSNQYSNTGVDFYTVTSAPTNFIADPYGQPKTATTLPSAEVDLTARDFKAPSILRYNIAVDHKLPWDLTATVEGVFSTTQNDIVYQNINLAPDTSNNGGLTPGGRIVGEGRNVWGSYASGRFTTKWIANPFSPGVFLIKNVDQGSNANVTVSVQRSVPEGLNGTLAYTWGMAKDVNSGNSTTASSGWRFNPTKGDPNNPDLTYSQWDRRHRVLAALSYRNDWGGGFATTFGLFYNGLSGRPISYMVSGDVNGDGRSDNDLAYIPRDANDILLGTGTSGTAVFTDRTNAAYATLFSYINSDPYLKDHKGQMSERSGAREPWTNQVDLHIGQEIPTIAGQKFEITVDVLNLLNLLNSEWGWQKTAPNQTVNLFTFRGLYTTAGPDYGKPIYQFTGLPIKDGVSNPWTPDNILSRWQMQIGIRYTL